MDDVPHENEQETTQWNEWSDLDKEMILIEGIEVDDDEDLAASDDGSLPDEDELPEYEEIPGIDSVHIEDAACHSPPSYVEDVASHLSKTPLQPIFEETTCEVSEDD
ncbi:hypothetical protein DOTSEDRAFT_46809 [Dothistroma septosporum NZE10]|uniref:Uncharacterized protein n=1 Tax=Dothistroma septosporum (strain NZE10 / CBS 128990) TaxID=675120 RepID=N1PE85_DOTSN|nr:hypothetical protein DOTSEDRAFT_46809 [Dothistroma septosporum NZE10]